jgi:hypothetical protein
MPNKNPSLRNSYTNKEELALPDVKIAQQNDK